MIEIRQLRYAVMTGAKLNFARAADELGAKQLTIGKKVAELAISLSV
jgi:DNA-binding transcriptional LysR family regulator